MKEQPVVEAQVHLSPIDIPPIKTKKTGESLTLAINLELVYKLFEPLVSPPSPDSTQFVLNRPFSDPLHGDPSKSAQYRDPRIPQSFDLDNSASERVLQ